MNNILNKIKLNIFSRTAVFFLAVAIPYTLAPCPCLYADVKIYPNAGTTSATFLKLGIGSRAIGMGEAFSALSDDVTALYWNPAGLVQLDKSELQITHNESFEGIKQEFLGFAKPLSNGSLGLAVYGVTVPKDLERRSGLFEEDPFEPFTASQGNFGAYDVAVHLSYAKRFNKNLSGGASLKLIQETIDDFSAYGAAVDLGALYKEPGSRLSLALVLENMGPKIKFIDQGYYPPAAVRIGGAWRWNDKVISTLDLSKSIDNFPFVMTGVEFTPVDFLAIRAGYKYRTEGQELADNLAGFAAGIGINLIVSNTSFRVDYAFTPEGVLGNSQRISITSFFGGDKNEPIKRTDEKIKTKKTKKHEAQKPEPAKQAQSDYTVYTASTDVKLRMAAGQMAIFSVKSYCEQSTVFYFEGIVRSLSSRDIETYILEKNGKENVIKLIDFKNDLSLPVRKVMLKMRIPRSWGEVNVENQDGYIINKDSITATIDYIDYSLKLDALEPLTIRKK